MDHQVICGKDVEHKITVDAGKCEGRDAECERSYWVYVPNAYCDRIKKNEAPEIQSEGGSSTSLHFPVVMTLHCYGCNGQQMMNQWKSLMTDASNFVIVSPEGLGNSWNAKNCCGLALDHELDDVGFLEMVLQDLKLRTLPMVNLDAVYGVGYSNGGYLVTYAAYLFRAVAPYSGHQYEVSIKNKPVSLFMHHALDDNYVFDAGCCTDPSMSECCCNISPKSPQMCVSSEKVFRDWSQQLALNANCSPTSMTGIGIDDFIILSEWHEEGIVCQTAKFSNCKIAATTQQPINATFCQYSHGGHMMKTMSTSMKEEFGLFFSKDACEVYGGGSWNKQQKTCTCNGISYDEIYCMQHDNSYHEMDSSSSLFLPPVVRTIDKPPIDIFVFVISSSFVIYMSCLIRKNMKSDGFRLICCQKRNKWMKVPTSDHEFDISYRETPDILEFELHQTETKIS